MTGGDPRSTGVYYDVEYNHDVYEAGTTKCTGPTGGDVIYDSPDDIDATRLDAGEHIPGIDQNPALIMNMTATPQSLLAARDVPGQPDHLPADLAALVSGCQHHLRDSEGRRSADRMV